MAHRPPPDEIESITHHFNIAGHDGYIHVGRYEDGGPCHLDLVLAKPGSTMGGMAEALAIAISLALQHGAAVAELVELYRGRHFDPRGHTTNPSIPYAFSLADYVVQWLAQRFPEGT